jgi:hypothetical protein
MPVAAGYDSSRSGAPKCRAEQAKGCGRTEPGGLTLLVPEQPNGLPQDGRRRQKEGTGVPEDRER